MKREEGKPGHGDKNLAENDCIIRVISSANRNNQQNLKNVEKRVMIEGGGELSIICGVQHTKIVENP